MLRIVLVSLCSLAILVNSIWALLALWYQLPWSLAARLATCALWLLGTIGVLFMLWSGTYLWAILAYLAMFVLIMLWWGRLEPTHERDWADDLARITTGVIDGDRVALSDVRNFHWRTLTDYDVRWESREYDLSRLRSVDLITSQWGLPGVAHILVSFGFDDGRFITFTVEIRRTRDQSFSAIGGFFKQFELNVLASDERDAVRLRTNVRGEEGRIYSIQMSERAMRRLFIAYVEEANRLAREPRHYHTITANCTIIVYNMMAEIIKGLPMDVRLFLSSHLPSYIKEHGGLVDRPLEELQQLGRFTERAREADQAEDFSWRIRQGVPGWDVPGDR
ncbi:Lnb N-terminal periplasmic domain-containing protein [Pseudomonas sp.]|jgi:hypothetical protein|uniref:Lnb N-terminal periplasmic domain-containing protein n=1 Tax=Pseudomonas sp. TaxID=306 RepID=UPI00272CBA4F|nr:DUF4105 domain-containing protein [Pseudomonas sp.]